ncbi:MAG: NAD(+) synthase [Lachnospiraceae bacterium]|nr:NAD(+) synthase [Lachnospiraceae bacterium]
MKDGFVKVCACTPVVTVADPVRNGTEIIKAVKEADSQGALIIVTPELSVTGYSCGDLFLQDVLIKEAENTLKRIAEETAFSSALIFAGVPVRVGGKLYDCAAALHRGKLTALIPKENIPDYGEFYEKRHFVPGTGETVTVEYAGFKVPMGTDILFRAIDMPKLTVGCEICEDLWTLNPPSTRHAGAGAAVMVNLSASDDLVSKRAYRRDLVRMTSARLLCGYIYAGAGQGESTQDVLYGGHRLIAENGVILSESGRDRAGLVFSEIDVDRLSHERQRMTTFPGDDRMPDHMELEWMPDMKETAITRRFTPNPFVPGDDGERNERCEEVLSIQSDALSKRLSHTGAKRAVVGVSGGLDSTLALLVTARAFDSLGLDRKGIITVTMPCFGTTKRTRGNAEKLSEALNTDFRTVDITDAVNIHLRDIGLPEDDRSVTFENAQARERTQVLMDIANMENALVIGTGDMSELAMGWATYNGDHMSMYGVNAGVPKTLVRYLVAYCSDNAGDPELSGVLNDILDTPVSPELLPPDEKGNIKQKTEDIIGPYELHDFFMYYLVRCGFKPSKILRMAVLAFDGEYTEDVVEKWLRTFIRRFFSQQFKRSCLPDGPKVGSCALSPRGDLRMPSDASAGAWLRELDGGSC